MHLRTKDSVKKFDKFNKACDVFTIGPKLNDELSFKSIFSFIRSGHQITVFNMIYNLFENCPQRCICDIDAEECRDFICRNIRISSFFSQHLKKKGCFKTRALFSFPLKDHLPRKFSCRIHLSSSNCGFQLIELSCIHSVGHRLTGTPEI